MNEFFGEPDKGFTFEFGEFSPRIDIQEDEKSMYLDVELPGVNKEDVKISVTDENHLVIKGEKRREGYENEEKEGVNFLRVERRFGEFQRSFLLPENVNMESVNAKYDNGVLHIKLEKKEPEKPKERDIVIE
jgi:HSP20 family protein